MNTTLDSGEIKVDRKLSMLDLDTKVYAWVCENQIRGIPVRGIEIRAEAKRLADELNIKQFCASNGWLWRFKNRHGIKSQQCNGNNGSDGKQMTSVLADALKTEQGEVKDEEYSGDMENSNNFSISDVMLSRLYNGTEIDIFATPGNLLQREQQKCNDSERTIIHGEEEEECDGENNGDETESRRENNDQEEHEIKDLQNSENPVAKTKKKKKTYNANANELKMNNKNNDRRKVPLNVNKNPQSSSLLYLQKMSQKTLLSSENVMNLRKYIDGILQILDNSSDPDLDEFYGTFNKFRNLVITKQRKRKHQENETNFYVKDITSLKNWDSHKNQIEYEINENCPSFRSSKRIKLSENNPVNKGDSSVYVIDSDEDNDDEEQSPGSSE